MRLVNTLPNGITTCVSPMMYSRHPMDHASKRGHTTSGGSASVLRRPLSVSGTRPWAIVQFLPHVPGARRAQVRCF